MYKIQLLLGLGAFWHRPTLDVLSRQPFASLSGPSGLAGAAPRGVGRDRLSLAVKRLMDILVSGLAILVLSPVFLFVAVAIALCDGRPFVFRHRRIGRDGRSFDCYKFRSMAKDSEARLQRLLAADPATRREWEESRKLKADPRVHAIGRLLRRSSLDELPQLVNILRGDMSLVGPRPIVAEEIVRFGPHFSAYKAVRPGLTGLWQISGRSGTTYEERIALDSHYVAHRSTANDLRILLKTPAVVLRAQGSC